MKYLLIFTLLFSLIVNSEARIYSKIVGQYQYQIEDLDCYVLKIELWSDNNTIDPTDDVKIYTYFTVVGSGCNNMTSNNKNQLDISFTENKDLINHKISVVNSKLFPNPASDFIVLQVENTLSLTQGDTELPFRAQIIDIHGNSLRQFQFNSKQDCYLLEIEGLPKGIYWVRSYLGSNLIASLSFLKI